MARAVLLAFLLFASFLPAQALAHAAPAPTFSSLHPAGHDEADYAHIKVEMELLEPLVQGVVAALDVTLTTHLTSASDLALDLHVDPAIEILADTGTTKEYLGYGESWSVTFLVTVVDEGDHFLAATVANDQGLEGYRQGWIEVRPLEPAKLVLDVQLRGSWSETEEIAPLALPEPSDETLDEPGPNTEVFADRRDIEAEGVASGGDLSTPLGDWMGAAASTTVTLKSCFSFGMPKGKPGEHSWLPLRWATYKVYLAVQGADIPVATGLTPKSGCISHDVPRTMGGAPTKAYVLYQACNQDVCVVNPHLGGTYSWQTKTRTAPSTASIWEFGQSTPKGNVWATRLLAFGDNGWNWAVNVAKVPRADAPLVKIMAPSQGASACTGACYSRDSRIWIPVDGKRDAREDTTAHEYGHHVHWHTVSTWHSPGGYHELCGQNQDAGLAWTEGFANFFAVKSNHDLGKKGVHGASGDRKYITTDFETTTCGGSGENELKVAASLWDLLDTEVDGKDDRSWPLADLFLALRTCNSYVVSFKAFYSGYCGWVQSGRSICGFQRAAYQNRYDFNEGPTLALAPPPAAASSKTEFRTTVTPGDNPGNGPCPIEVKFGISTSSVCYTIVGQRVATKHAYADYHVGTADTSSAADGQGRYLCATVTDGMEPKTVASSTRMVIDNSPPTRSVTFTGDMGGDSWYRGPVTVVQTCTDPHTATVQTRDRSRHTDHWDDWIEFSGTYVESESAPYGLGCRNAAWLALTPLTGAIKIDYAAPTTSATTDGTDGWNARRVNVTLACTDSSLWTGSYDVSGCQSTRWRVDNGTWRTYAGTFYLGVDGHRWVQFDTIDVAGNREQTKLLEVFIDRTAPALTLDVSGVASNGWHRDNATVTPTCTDPLSGPETITYGVNGGPQGAYTSPVEVVTAGETSLVFVCTDKAGNAKTASTIVKIDKDDPSASMTLTTVGNYAFLITWSAADAHSGLWGNVVLSEQRPGASTFTNVCTWAVSGSTASGSCERASTDAPTCYQLEVTDAVGRRIVIGPQCIATPHE